MIKMCYKCGKHIDIGVKYRMVPFEKPYCNLFFHLDCLLDIGDPTEYVSADLQRFYKYLDAPKETKNRKNMV